ncbi:MAG: mechanosensitive ion channel [Nitrososphaerota archaeon]|nr:mechanosensitive ion channel [Nitrososphaerota archaeon]
MAYVDLRYLYTVASMAVLVVLVYLVSGTMRRRLSGLQGYGRLVYLVVLAMTVGLVASLAYAWGILQVFLGSLAAAGAVGVVVMFGILPLMTDIISGVLIHLDRDINVGVDVEIDGKRGIIQEISLTRTKMASTDGLVIFPNRRFRETAVIVRTATPARHRAGDLANRA